MHRLRALAASLAVLWLACGKHGATAPTPVPAVRVSGATTFAPGCNGAPQAGTLFPNAEVEPSLAVDPANPAHLVGVWQQDRWSNGGSQGLLSAVSRDGGHTWARSAAPFSRCAGGNASNGGDYERASDPWSAISPDGAAYQIALVFNPSDGVRRGVLVSRSADGGGTWGNPRALQTDIDATVVVDKEAIAADPSDPHFVYAAWDRITNATGSTAAGTGPTWFTRTIDGGTTWEQPARVVYDPGLDAQTIGNVPVVLPDHSVVIVFAEYTHESSPGATVRLLALRSIDHGASFSLPPAVVAVQSSGDALDPKTGKAIRSGATLPAVAVDQVSGKLAVVWQDYRFSTGAAPRLAIALSTSSDGGVSWSAPVHAAGEAGFDAFLGSVAFGAGGAVAVAYDDFRKDVPGDPDHAYLTRWLRVSHDGGATWKEIAVGGPADLHAAPLVSGDGATGARFLGDYQGLVSSGAGFIPFFTLPNTGDAANPTDVFVQPIDAQTGLALASHPPAGE